VSPRSARAGQRHLIDHAAVIRLVREERVANAVMQLLGANAFAFKATLFDKTNEANWLVAWHQDVSIPITEKYVLAGWSGWSTKEGVAYAQPPESILTNVLALRLHLDDCNELNGPLSVKSGSHRFGKLAQAEIDITTADCESCTVVGAAGSALFLRPLLVHASSKALKPAHRRVLHIEFAAFDLPQPLEWHRRVLLDN
jgi:ectoine hydroxylase-related dioxygenase (phytanoyl-CoA dioxygenase family)